MLPSRRRQTQPEEEEEEKKRRRSISWACTAHCSRLLFELKWTGKAFIWRHLNVVICDFDTFRSCFHQNQRFALTTIVITHIFGLRFPMLILRQAESRVLTHADSKRQWIQIAPFTVMYSFMLPSSEEARFREHALRIGSSQLLLRAQVNRKGVYMTSFKRGYMWFCVQIASTRISVIALTTIVNAHFWAFWISWKRRLFENKHGRNSVLL